MCRVNRIFSSRLDKIPEELVAMIGDSQRAMQGVAKDKRTRLVCGLRKTPPNTLLPTIVRNTEGIWSFAVALFIGPTVLADAPIENVCYTVKGDIAKSEMEWPTDELHHPGFGDLNITISKNGDLTIPALDNDRFGLSKHGGNDGCEEE